jgi:hypothetical protein
MPDGSTGTTKNHRTVARDSLGRVFQEPVVKEFWYSPRMGINVITKRFDPRASAVQNFVVGNINQAEPNARMFEPPAGYRIVPMDGQ